LAGIQSFLLFVDSINSQKEQLWQFLSFQNMHEDSADYKRDYAKVGLAKRDTSINFMISRVFSFFFKCRLERVLQNSCFVVSVFLGHKR
jgi:hypothetical protein